MSYVKMETSSEKNDNHNTDVGQPVCLHQRQEVCPVHQDKSNQCDISR